MKGAVIDVHVKKWFLAHKDLKGLNIHKFLSKSLTGY